MSNAVTLMREFVSYFEGIAEAIDGKAPSKKQWDRISERVAAMRTLLEQMPADGANGHHVMPAAPAKAPEPGVDPVPGGATTSAKWKKNVKKALIEEGCDPESAEAFMADGRFRVDLNKMPLDYAKSMIAGAY